MTEAAAGGGDSWRVLCTAQTILFLVSVILAVMTFTPLLWMVSIAFKPSGEVFRTGLIPHRPTLANFIYVFTELNFLQFLLNTLFVSLAVSTIALLFHSMAGYALSRLRFPGRGLIFLAMISTYVISLPVILVPLFVLVRELGMLDSYAGLIVPSIFNSFGVFLLRQFYLTIPRELEEAAIMDGAGYWRIYWSIIVPLSRPILSALAILFFLSSWNGYLWPLTIISNPKLWVVQVAMARFQSQYSASWNYVMAASTIVALPMLLVFIVFQRRIIESIKIGGVA